MQFIDGLGFEYQVSSEDLEEFEHRRGICLIIAIAIKVAVVCALVLAGHLGM